MLRLWRRMSSSDDSARSTSSAPGTTAAPSSTSTTITSTTATTTTPAPAPASPSSTIPTHPYCNNNNKRSLHSTRGPASQTTLPEAIAETPHDTPDTTPSRDYASPSPTSHRRLRSLRLPVLTVERATPPSPDPPSATESKPSHSNLFRRRSFRPPLLRASSKTSYSGQSLTETLPSPVHESDPHPQSHSEFVDSTSASKSAEAGAENVGADPPGDNPPMARRKIWVCRPGASPTLVQIVPDDLVDDVRDMVISKYRNSLGRNFDAPDVTLRIIPREKGPNVGDERTLGPEEPIASTLDAYFPGGQTVDEALIIDVPRAKTPRASPRPVVAHAGQYYTDPRPLEDQDTGYFPPMPAGSINLRPPTGTAPDVNGRIDPNHQPQPLPSPSERRLQQRPGMRRQHTSSPISSGGTAATNGYGHAHRATRQGTRGTTSGGHTPNPSLPTPPASEAPPGMPGQPVTSPSNISPRPPPSAKPKKTHKLTSNDQSQAPPPLHLGGLDGLLYADAVPPINVLIVEDNIINLKLLEMFVKRLKVRWASVMNGRDAVDKWREGGFHLVLMDIQLPIMSGLEATKEIRRLERVNGIGVFARSEGEERAPSPLKYATSGEQRDAQGDDKLTGMFKSPVIIVALTASSLQSDRHEALAAGCNDFLTKPVNFPWFERKILEWGCMQALIDFDGWRQWKELSTEIEAAAKAAPPKKKKKRELSAEEQAQRDADKAALMAKMSSG